MYAFTRQGTIVAHEQKGREPEVIAMCSNETTAALIVDMANTYERNARTADTHTLYSLDVYVLRIRQWAADRNLIEGATSQAQTVKLFEEGGEVAHAVARGDRDGLKDGIGDMVIVLTILAAQNGLTLEECVAAAYDEIKDRTGRMVDGIFVRDA